MVAKHSDTIRQGNISTQEQKGTEFLFYVCFLTTQLGNVPTEPWVMNPVLQPSRIVTFYTGVKFYRQYVRWKLCRKFLRKCWADTQSLRKLDMAIFFCYFLMETRWSIWLELRVHVVEKIVILNNTSFSSAKCSHYERHIRNDIGLKKSRFIFISKHSFIVRNSELCPPITLQTD